MPPPPRHSAMAALASLKACLDDPRVKAASSLLQTLLPNTAAHVRQLAAEAPAVVDAVADRATAQVVREARTLDRAVTRAIEGALDELLTAAHARTPKDKRITAGSKSRARQAARQAGRRR